ncbi:hypothetical protein AB1Y20_005059 [Prymnesium parvum]|uniref:Uncharacterized protein n=1 Tax=Prymnesium parvum TaxID=97485 RepID=A0AB34J2Q0_PRYPA
MHHTRERTTHPRAQCAVRVPQPKDHAHKTTETHEGPESPNRTDDARINDKEQKELRLPSSQCEAPLTSIVESRLLSRDSCITRRRKRAKRQIDEGMPGGLGSEDTANVVHEAPAQDELHQPLSFARIAIGVALQAAAAALPTS